jgi:hypothetical protein
MEKTNLGLVEFAKKARDMKAGYVYGTFGQILTPSLLDYKRKQYPYQVERYIDFIKQHYLNKVTYDCVGLIKGYLWTNQNGSIVYDASTDVSADGMFNKATVKGDIKTIPEVPGVCVRRPGHIGVYIGNGKVIEAKGTTSGVVETELKKFPWTHWLECPFINYIREDKGGTSDVFKNGDRGERIKVVQTLLNIAGADLAVDGVFGPKTEAAVKNFQSKRNLEPTGQVDTATMCDLSSVHFEYLWYLKILVEQMVSRLRDIKAAYENLGDIIG